MRDLRPVEPDWHDVPAGRRDVYADVDAVLWPAAELSVRAQLDYLREQRLTLEPVRRRSGTQVVRQLDTPSGYRTALRRQIQGGHASLIVTRADRSRQAERRASRNRRR